MPFNKPMDDWTLKLSKRMVNKVKQDSFMHITVVGERNYGKTYYSLKNMALSYYRLSDYHYDKEGEIESFERALDDVIFTPQQFKKKVKDNRMNKTKSPFFILDDAGVHFDSGLYHRNLYLSQLVNACLDTIKDVTNCLIVTCPFKETLTKRLREYDGYDVTLYTDRGYERYGTCIKWYRRPTGDKRWRKEFEDSFSCWIPNTIHEKYLELRDKFTLDIIDELDSIEEKYEKRKKTKIS